jgi:threonyl-tRNA synthetase
MRVRGFTQDDAHIFLPPELIEEEIVSLLKMIQKLMNLFQFEDLEVYLSTQEEKFVEDPELTEKATSALKNALDKVQIPYKINPGEGAFYGPKIDITLRDSLKRRWQCGTIQVDFILPRRFGLKFIDSSGKEEIPVMIHRALVGSLERFVGILIEHFGGAFPFFLAPTQVKVIPVSEAHHPYGKEILQMIKKLGYRGEGDFRPETLNKKIRDSQTAKIPLTLVVGEKEMREKTVSYRKYGEKEGKTIPLESLPFFLSDLTRTSKRES